ncbi:hypothetical protein HR13_05810 [Porphyromonas gulae]|nr:hypothetical protein HR13_05810 [Porphyromonas gulae]
MCTKSVLKKYKGVFSDKAPQQQGRHIKIVLRGKRSGVKSQEDKFFTLYPWVRNHAEAFK